MKIKWKYLTLNHVLKKGGLQADDVKNELIKACASKELIGTSGNGSANANKEENDPKYRKVVALQYSKR